MSDLTFTKSEEDFIRTKFKLTENQLEVFLAQCKRYNLNPIANQIYPQVRQGRLNITTGIDGYRLVADRTGQYAGNDDPVYNNEDKPTVATVTVYKIVAGTRCAFTASARWDQYYPGDKQGFMWNKMPHLMLGKCAEALALRKAFPAELSGIYTNEEMEQAGTPTAPVPETIKIDNKREDQGKFEPHKLGKKVILNEQGGQSVASFPLDSSKKVVGADPDVALKGTCKVVDCVGRENSNGLKFWVVTFDTDPDKSTTTFSETIANDCFDAMQYDLRVHVNTKTNKAKNGKTYINIENLTLAEIPAGKE
tara:strand:+ start:2428 stop:3351 length:924 start_codon:yes stop_codon:yes gene_type:complete